jgi:CRISPR-associated protein Csx10
MIAITYELCALQPLLLTRLEGDPNSSVSYPYVPGSAIRGALASRYIARRRRERDGRTYDPMKDTDVRRLFFDGAARYLNAYPLDRDGWRCLPAPLSWFYEKQKGLKPGTTLHDFSAAAADPAGLLQPKNVGARFWRRFAETASSRQKDWEDEEEEFAVVKKEAERIAATPYVEFTEPVWEINVHTFRERRKGRADEDEGAVFRYQALAPEHSFGGVILAETEADAGVIAGLLQEGDLWLGGSRSAGYGRARAGGVRQNRAWNEGGAQAKDVAPDGRLVITLLSDAILRRDCPHGGCADRLFPELLPPPLAGAVVLEESYKHVVPVGGFNRKWGLPLDQAQAIAAGSVFVYRAKAPIAASELEALEREGIGERRVEGFGRVAANGHPDASLVVREAPTTWRLRQEVTLSEAEESLAEEMVQRLLRRELDRRLAGSIASERAALGGSPVTKTQLARLRTLALNALPKRDVPRLLAFLLDANLNKPAREQLRGARIDGTRLLDWLAQRLLNALPAAELKRLQALLRCLEQERPVEDCQWSADEVQDLLDKLGGSAARLLPGDDAAGIAALLADDRARRQAQKEHREPRIDGTRLAERIEERLRRPMPIWQWLDARQIPMPRLGKVQAGLNDEDVMAREYTLRLVEGVLHRAAKEETHG